MIKPYRYLIFKLFKWSNKKGTSTPVADTLITLSFVHFIQLFTAYNIFLKFFPALSIYEKTSTTTIYVFFALFGLSNSLFLFNKKKWKEYHTEFENETEAQRRKGNLAVLVYLIGSILLFFISLPILFGF